MSLIHLVAAALAILCAAVPVSCDDGTATQSPETSSIPWKTQGPVWTTPSATVGKLWGQPCTDPAFRWLFVPSMSGYLHVVDARTGEPIKRVKVAQRGLRGSTACTRRYGAKADSLELADWVVIATTLDSTVAAYLMSDLTNKERETVSSVWLYEFPMPNINSFYPVVSPGNNFVYVGFRENALVQLHLGNGTTHRLIRTSAGVWSKPLITSNRVVFPVTATATAYSFPHSETGSRILDGAPSPALASTAAERDALWVHDLVPGATHWKARVKRWIFSSFALLPAGSVSETCGAEKTKFAGGAEDVVVLGANDGSVKLLSLETGTQRCYLPVPGAVSSEIATFSPKGEGSSAIFVTEEGFVYRLDSCCKVVWKARPFPKFAVRTETGAALFFPGGSEAEAIVVIGDAVGNVGVLRATSGELVGKAYLKGCVIKGRPTVTQQLVTDSLSRGVVTVIVGCENGNDSLIRIDFESPLAASKDGGKQAQPIQPSDERTKAPTSSSTPGAVPVRQDLNQPLGRLPGSSATIGGAVPLGGPPDTFRSTDLALVAIMASLAGFALVPWVNACRRRAC